MSEDSSLQSFCSLFIVLSSLVCADSDKTCDCRNCEYDFKSGNYRISFLIYCAIEIGFAGWSVFACGTRWLVCGTQHLILPVIRPNRFFRWAIEPVYHLLRRCQRHR
jgi:hypothetical protein